MKQYTTESGKAGRASEIEPDYGTGSDEQGGMKVDPSVRLGALKGEPLGSVPLERTMQKPQAYIPKKGTP